MTANPPLTRDIGSAERNLRQLLERELQAAGLSFPEWVVRTVLDGRGPLTARQLVEAQLDARVAADAVEAGVRVERLLSSGVVAAVAAPDAVPDADGTGGDGDGPRLGPTATGQTLYRPVRAAVDRITDDLFDDLPPHDVEATCRTLAEITRRAQERLTQPAT